MADSSVCIIDNAACSGVVRSRSLCNAHYLRWCRGGKPDELDGVPVPQLPTLPTLAERFATKFHRSPGCWEWIGTHDSDGYGVIKSRGKMLKAHRLSYSLAYLNGVMPPSDVLVCHHCDNPPCVRPDHLFLGDASTNSGDMAAKLRGVRGSDHHLSKLTADDVLAIRADTSTSDSALARKYGVRPGSVAMVRRFGSWRHLG